MQAPSQTMIHTYPLYTVTKWYFRPRVALPNAVPSVYGRDIIITITIYSWEKKHEKKTTLSLVFLYIFFFNFYSTHLHSWSHNTDDCSIFSTPTTLRLYVLGAPRVRWPLTGRSSWWTGGRDVLWTARRLRTWLRVTGTCTGGEQQVSSRWAGGVCVFSGRRENWPPGGLHPS